MRSSIGIVRILASSLHPLEFKSFTDLNLNIQNRLDIEIRNANFHNFDCQYDQTYHLRPSSAKRGTKLDLDLLKFDTGVGSSILINLKIVHDKISFLPDVGGKRYAITLGDSEYKDEIFNIGPDIDENSSLKEISFACRIVDTFHKIARPFNIGLLVADDDEDGYEYPIFIDPKVENDGN